MYTHQIESHTIHFSPCVHSALIARPLHLFRIQCPATKCVYSSHGFGDGEGVIAVSITCLESGTEGVMRCLVVVNELDLLIDMRFEGLRLGNGQQVCEDRSNLYLTIVLER